MRKFLATLVLITFAFVMQMPFVHALDMGDDMTMTTSTHMSAEHGIFCDKSTNGPTKGCASEVSESKWVQGVEKINISVFLVVAFAVFFFFLDFNTIRVRSDRFFRRRIFHHGTLYLGLYGIVRNVN